MRPDAVRGHLDAMILAVIGTRRLHGYAVAEELQQRSDGALDVATGTLYPALRRLEDSGLLASEWSTVGGRKRRTYRLTRAGAKALSAERTAWRDLSGVMDAVLGPDPT